MPIKTVREHIHDHFSNNLISKHWNHFSNSGEFIEFQTQDHGLEFRKFSYNDIDKCAKLFKEVFSDYPWYDDWVSVEQAKKYLTELIQNPVFEGFVVYECFEIVGVCLGRKRSWWMGKEFFIDEFFVSNKKQGNGVGTNLMNYVKDSLIKQDYTRLALLTNKEIPAEEFYVKNGFYTNDDRISMINEL
jgi:GNAT superfamily N-acetyltransferase